MGVGFNARAPKILPGTLRRFPFTKAGILSEQALDFLSLSLSQHSINPWYEKTASAECGYYQDPEVLAAAVW